jgi:hypothetical protein
MKSLVGAAVVLFFTFGSSYANLHHGWKGTVHLIGVPIIEATGIYSDVRILQTADRNFTKAGAITNLSLLGVQACLGATIFLGKDDQSPMIRVIHRIVGASVIASAIWISVQGTHDPGVPNLARNTAYTHTIVAAMPLLLFTF